MFRKIEPPLPVSMSKVTFDIPQDLNPLEIAQVQSTVSFKKTPRFDGHRPDSYADIYKSMVEKGWLKESVIDVVWIPTGNGGLGHYVSFDNTRLTIAKILRSKG